MELSFRWFDRRDPVTLQQIRQIPGMVGVVTALYQIPPGQLWPADDIDALARVIAQHGLRWNVVESLPVHEDIKLGRPRRDALIDIYCENIRRLAAVGVEVLCYNFMPLFDWMRTDLAMELPDGSNAMQYDDTQLAHIRDPWEADLPAYFPLDESPDELKTAYRALTKDDLWANLAYFLRGIITTAAETGMRLAIHPDDPPWPIFGLPRMITGAEALERLLALVDHPANGVCFCTGSLGADPANDLPALVRLCGGRIHFAHLRNLKHTGVRRFHEVAHPRACGDLDLPAVMRALHAAGFSGPLRPDHGRNIWGEAGIPGYGLYDRALGATYLLGLWEALEAGSDGALTPF